MPSKITVYRKLINKDQIIKKYPIDPDGKIIIKVGGLGRGNFSYKPLYDPKAVFNCGFMKLFKAVAYWDGSDTLVLPPEMDGTQNKQKGSYKDLNEYFKSEGLKISGRKSNEDQIFIYILLGIQAITLFFILNGFGIINV